MSATLARLAKYQAAVEAAHRDLCRWTDAEGFDAEDWATLKLLGELLDEQRAAVAPSAPEPDESEGEPEPECCPECGCKAMTRRGAKVEQAAKQYLNGLDQEGSEGGESGENVGVWEYTCDDCGHSWNYDFGVAGLEQFITPKTDQPGAITAFEVVGEEFANWPKPAKKTKPARQAAKKSRKAVQQ